MLKNPPCLYSTFATVWLKLRAEADKEDYYDKPMGTVRSEIVLSCMDLKRELKNLIQKHVAYVSP